MQQKEKEKKKGKPLLQQPNLGQVGYLCRRVMQASLRDLQATIPDLDVTHGQMGTLVLIACNPGIMPTEICRSQGQEKPTITASLDKLERRKLIIRKASRTDRRSFAIYLTAKGQSFYDAMSPRARDSDQRLTRCLTRDERSKLLEYLLRIYYCECAQDKVENVSAADIRRHAKNGAGDLRLTPPANSKQVDRYHQDQARVTFLRHLKEVERYVSRLRRTARGLG